MKRICLLTMALLFVTSSVAFAGGGKIAVAANGESPEALVSSQAGPAPFILFFDADGKFIEALANPGKDGLAVATFLAERGATVVVAEGFGPKIVEAMKGKGIKAVSFKGNAEEAVKKVLQAN
jgi:predicted Fe-Mo cluster-binding NifX family protein